MNQEFVSRVEEILGKEEISEFLKCYERESVHGLRVNGLKSSAEEMSGELAVEFGLAGGDELALDLENESNLENELGLEPVPWCPGGLYYDASCCAPGKHPYHQAGLYYIQEPSAMAPVEQLLAQPGERVLDLCAAPGGKTTQIAASMQGRGLLVANEPHPARAKILSENVERMGVTNCIVTNELPQRLREQFGCAFHRILVDAPCSGEGMFRKDEEAQNQWSVENVLHCADRQDEILDEAYEMLLPGGRLVYSTCTFAKEEDEGSVERFVQRHPDITIEKQERLWPHKVKGEGHFLAVLTKAGMEAQLVSPPNYYVEKGFSYKSCKELKAFVAEALSSEFEDMYLKEGCFTFFGEQLYLLPAEMPSVKGLKVLRTGLHLGTVRKGRFEPAHALAHGIDVSLVRNVTNLSPADSRVLAYLNGQTINVEGENGWHLITVGGFALGWGKLVRGVMKNHYPKGLRIQGV